MNSRLENVLQIALVLLVVAFIAGHALGQPVLVSYVETGSMEPTIGEGDGFLVVPSVLAGPPESGDVIVFQAETLHNGSVTTHRVVGTADNGYVTQGDANTFPDQEGDEPPVTDDQILAKAMTVNGEPIVVPGLGRAIQAAKGTAGVLDSLPLVSRVLNGVGTSSIVFLGIGLCLVGVGLMMGFGAERTRNTTRTVRRRESFEVRRLSIVLAVVIVVAATTVMLLASGSAQYGLVAVEDDEIDEPLVLEAGTVGTVTHDLPHSGVTPVVVIRESPHEDVDVIPRTIVVGPRSSAETSLRVDAPDSKGRFDRAVSEHRYVAVLPPSLLFTLHSVHPWLAIFAVDVVLALVILLAGAMAWPGKYIRVRTSTGRSHWRRLSQLLGRQN